MIQLTCEMNVMNRSTGTDSIERVMVRQLRLALRTRWKGKWWREVKSRKRVKPMKQILGETTGDSPMLGLCNTTVGDWHFRSLPFSDVHSDPSETIGLVICWPLCAPDPNKQRKQRPLALWRCSASATPNHQSSPDDTVMERGQSLSALQVSQRYKSRQTRLLAATLIKQRHLWRPAAEHLLSNRWHSLIPRSPRVVTFTLTLLLEIVVDAPFSVST